MSQSCAGVLLISLSRYLNIFKGGVRLAVDEASASRERNGVAKIPKRDDG